MLLLIKKIGYDTCTEMWLNSRREYYLVPQKKKRVIKERKQYLWSPSAVRIACSVKVGGKPVRAYLSTS
jgi:hypothetical protein